MKKLAFIFILFSCLACSSSDDASQEENKATFNPPSWIQGTWQAELSEDISVTFTVDNFCNTVSGTEICFKSVIDESLGLITVENESSSTTEYKFTIKRPTESTDFHYKKISDTKIAYMLLNIETATYDKQ